MFNKELLDRLFSVRYWLRALLVIFAALSLLTEHTLLNFFAVTACVYLLLVYVQEKIPEKFHVLCFWAYVMALLSLHLVADIVTYQMLSVSSSVSYFLLLSAACFAVLTRMPLPLLVVASLSINLIFLIIPAFYIVYYHMYSVGATANSIHAVLQTNITQAGEFISDLGIWKYLALLVVIWLAIAFVTCKIFTAILARHKHSFSSATLLAIGIIFLVAWKNNPRLIADMWYAGKEYRRELLLFRQEAQRRMHDKENITAKKSATGEVYVVVIGESLNKQHLSIYGYPRSTTPKLQQHQGLLVFDNSYAIHSFTRYSLPYSLTAANQYNLLKYYHAPTIIDILHRAHFKTFWLTNHSLYSLWANAVTVMAKQAGYLKGFNYHIGMTLKAHHFDEILLPDIAELLANRADDENMAIFVHLYGNHRDACHRFPPQYEKFHGPLPVSVFGGLADTQNYRQINCYDNSVLYHDSVVASILTLLKKAAGVSGFIYFPDHGFDAMGGRGQNIDLFSFDMTTTPLLAWFSAAYQHKYPHVYATFKNNRQRLFSSDLIYDTLLGLFSIETDHYSARFDLSSAHYRLDASEALVGNGQIKYNVNPKFHQNKNIAAIIDTGRDTRIIPSRVNSIGKLTTVYRAGYRAFAIATYYDPRKNCLVVGHHAARTSDTCLASFLSNINTAEVQSILLLAGPPPPPPPPPPPAVYSGTTASSCHQRQACHDQAVFT